MFQEPRLKIARADTLFAEFSTTASQFLQSSPYVLRIVEDPAQVHLVGEVRALVPNELGLILGDALHNLRASLDVLANEAICKETGMGKRDASFPVANDPEVFDKKVRKYLPGASNELIATVRSIQPFQRSTTWLRQLHELDIADKHKITSPVVGNPAFHNIRAKQLHTAGTMTIGSIKLNATAIGMQRFVSVAKSMNFAFDPSANHTFYFAVTEQLAAQGVGVEQAFSCMRSEVIHVLEVIEQFFLG